MVKKEFKLSKEDALTAYGDGVMGLVESLSNEDTFRRRKCTLGTYLRSIYRNKCRDKQRQSQTQKPMNWIMDVVDFPEKTHDVLRDMIMKENWANVQKCMKKLSETCRIILIGSAHDGLSSQELAEQLNFKNANSVNVTRHRCRINLMEICQQYA